MVEILTCKVGKDIINTLEYEDNQIRKWSKKGILKCPACNGRMIYKNGEFKIAHFAHEQSDCDLKYSESETEEHLSGKTTLYNWLKTQNVKNLKLEAWIPETQQRPDIYFEYNNKKYVIEYQCSPIATNYSERHRLYQLAGIEDIWILGTQKYNMNNRIDYIENKHKIYDYSTKIIEREIINEDLRQLIFLRDRKLIFISKEQSCQISSVVKYALQGRMFNIDNVVIDDLISNKNLATKAIEHEIYKKEQEKIRYFNESLRTCKNFIKKAIENTIENHDNIYQEQNTIVFNNNNTKYIVEFINNNNNNNINERDIKDKYSNTNIIHIPIICVTNNHDVSILKRKPTTICEFDNYNYLIDNKLIMIKGSTYDEFTARHYGTNHRGRACVRYSKVGYYKYRYEIKEINDIAFNDLSYIKNISFNRKIVIIDDFYTKPKGIRTTFLKDFNNIDSYHDYFVNNVYEKIKNINSDIIYLVLPKKYDSHRSPIRRLGWELENIKNNMNQCGFSNVEIYWG